MTLGVTFGGVTDWEGLGRAWRALESRTACSFFQSWSWIGCLAAERFDRPVLMEARQDGRIVGLALFNHRPGLLRDTLWLHETGDPAWDDLFIEYNGVLIDADAAPSLRMACAAAILRYRPRRWPGLLGRRLIMSGIAAPEVAPWDASGAIIRQQSRIAPWLDLAELRRTGRRHFDVLSANTRAQLRRSLRQYARHGTLQITPARDVPTAYGFLDDLAHRHQTSWQRRGKPGAFANPRFARFHRALIAQALPRGEVALLRVSAGEEIVGYLYNFQHRGRVLAYQSGFDYAAADRHAKPGLTCHHLAIERSLDESQDAYDFLAGDDRYKRSLASRETVLHWLTLAMARAGHLGGENAGIEPVQDSKM